MNDVLLQPAISGHDGIHDQPVRCNVAINADVIPLKKK